MSSGFDFCDGNEEKKPFRKIPVLVFISFWVKDINILF